MGVFREAARPTRLRWLIALFVLSSWMGWGCGGGKSPPQPADNPPVANAGDNLEAVALDLLMLDGSKSYDPEGLPLTYRWAFTAKPDGSLSELVDSNTVKPSFIPDRAGQYVVQLIVSDGKLDSSPAAVTVTISDFIAVLGANPISGGVPLTVYFTALAKTAGGTVIIWYNLSFGDGSQDWGSYFGGNVSHDYSKKGTYEAVLTVTDALSRTVTARVTITVTPSPPVATADVVPSNGAVPLAVQLNGTGTDPDGKIVLYQWDFTGDGTWDWESTTTGSTGHTYENQGTFGATFRVTDDDGLTGTATVQLTTIRVGPPGSPTAKAIANPQSGDSPLNVFFQDDGSYDPDGSIVKWEWDFTGDGVYEAEGPSASYNYQIPGTYFAMYRVTDNTGLTGIFVLEIKVSLRVSLKMSKDTIDPSKQEKTQVETELSGPSTVSIYVKNAAGAVMRTLVAGASRAAGNYSDEWDGKDGNGVPVNDGAYYAVMEYTEPAGKKTLDLTYTTGGEEVDINGTGELKYPPQTFNYPFYPFNNQPYPLDMTFNHRAYMVTIILGCFYQYTHVGTVIDRFPMGQGHHIVYWDGTDDKGKFVDYCVNGVIYGGTGFTLPDNGVIVQGSRPILSNVAADSNYFSPMSRTQGVTVPKVRISFDLSETSHVFLSVFSMDGNDLLFTDRAYNLGAGRHSVTWEGKNAKGYYVPKGQYRATLQAMDTQGSRSLEMHTLLKVSY